jgi:hypothetical protein
MTKKIEKKKFKDTKLGLFLSQKAPQLFSQVGDFLPDSGTLGIIKKGIEILGPKDKEEGFEQVAKLERKLTEIDIQNQQIELEELRAKLSDRSDARQREIESIKLNKKSPVDGCSWVSGCLAVTLGCYLL